jgi:hypothetical protein
MLKLGLQFFAKRKTSFTTKGLLDLETGCVYETSKSGDVTVEFFNILKEFDKMNVSISISEEQELGNVESESDDE